MTTKFIFVLGGVISGLGKGITAASLGQLLKSRGLKVTIQKFDPYLNIDPGTMSPYQHGEVFVTDDGAETDLDLGHYERFTDVNLNKYNSISAGKIYSNVLEKERKGDYLGATIQIIPHITNEIKENITKVGGEYDVVITEIGGTVGDIESLPFLEAIRQFALDVGKENVLYIHLTYMPRLESGELKTKPTQHSVSQLRAIGIQPDILICRTDKKLPEDVKNKLSLFCNVEKKCIIQNMNAKSIYKVPLFFEKENFSQVVCEKLNLDCKPLNLTEWTNFVNKEKSLNESVNIALVGKYVELPDAYLSVVESLKHAGIANDVKINIEWINAEELNEENYQHRLHLNSDLQKIHGILVPGGFGDRGIEGKILAIKYAREHNIPFLGICLGMQMAAIEFARNVLGYKDAHSTEFNSDTKNPVIHIMEEQKYIKDMGGTMRLGSYPCKIKFGSKTWESYNYTESFDHFINERHRHRFEFNNDYKDEFENNNFIVTGLNPEYNLVEIIELKNHPFFIGVQFHPEFKSRPNKPHPIFREFITSSKNIKKEN